MFLICDVNIVVSSLFVYTVSQIRCQFIFCSESVKYELISMQIGRNVQE